MASVRLPLNARGEWNLQRLHRVRGGLESGSAPVELALVGHQPPLDVHRREVREVVIVVHRDRRAALTSTGGSPGLSVSLDGRSVLYWQVDQLDSDIMLVDNFR